MVVPNLGTPGIAQIDNPLKSERPVPAMSQAQTTEHPEPRKTFVPYIKAVHKLQRQARGLIKCHGDELEAAIPGVTALIRSNDPNNILRGFEQAKPWLEIHVPKFQALTLPEPPKSLGAQRKKPSAADTPEPRGRVKELLRQANQLLEGKFGQQVRDLTPKPMRDIIKLGEDQIIAQGKIKKLEAAVAQMERFEGTARAAYDKHHC